MFTRRQALLTTLFGAGAVGLRSLATGLPVSFLMNPKKALADNPTGMCSPTKAQFIIFQTSGSGDPWNANCPGTFEDKNITHADPNTYPQMAPTPIKIAGNTYTAAACWGQLPQAALDRTTFWHIMTDTPVHPKQPEVMKLMAATYQGEMLCSILAKQMAPCLGTVQTQPIALGATSPAEGLSFSGQAQPIIPPLALKATLTSPAGPLTDLQAIRDQSLNQLYDLYRNGANPAQQQYIDSLVTSQRQVRGINQQLLNQLSMIKDNSADSQVQAAVTLIQMKVAPLMTIHIPMGGDNHRDVGFMNEATQHQTGLATLANLMNLLQQNNLQDQVTFLSMNVFGRTLVGSQSMDGRQHNPNSMVAVTIGKQFKGGVVGAVGPVGNDYGCLPIDSKTGKGVMGGDIAPASTLASFGKTVLASVGVDSATIDQQITTGTTISTMLNNV